MVLPHVYHDDDNNACESYLGGVGKRAEDWQSASPVDRQEQQSEHKDSYDGCVRGHEDGDEDVDEDGKDRNCENLLAVSQTNWGVISGTAGNGGEREKLKC